MVLAVGNSPAPIRNNKKGEKILKSPWNLKDIAQAAHSTNVALIGTGLTAIDTVLVLEKSLFRGSYTLISRKGLLPQPHPSVTFSPHLPVDIEQKLKEAKSQRTLLREFRALVSQGIDWHALIDALRPHSHDIWRNFSVKEKQRFIRHLRSHWDSHRHRAPQQSLNILQNLKETGRLKIIRGRANSYRDANEKIWFSVLHAGSERVLGPFDNAFDCTGIWNNLKDCNSPLIGSMIENNLAVYDDLFLGLKASSTGQLIGENGAPIRGMYTLGALRRGELWETTAVREIRQQASKIAKGILARIIDNDLPQSHASIASNE